MAEIMKGTHISGMALQFSPSAQTVVCKFGGTSLADACRIRQVRDVILSNANRRCVVVSAPGKRFGADKKITDLLYHCHHEVTNGAAANLVFAPIRDRFEEIARELGVSGYSEWLDETEAGLGAGETEDWLASRGEYLNARLIAAFLGARFVEAADGIFFGEDGRFDGARTYPQLREMLAGDELTVIPGFYGCDVQGQVKTFSRGGSDVTGAIVARAMNASVYENWTDVDGVRMADPRLIAYAQPIREITYEELRELAYMGASVLHDEAIFPVREAGIPIHIRDTNHPELPGTWIRPTRGHSDEPIVGVAGRKGFTIILVEKSLMNQELGFGRRMLQVLEEHNISWEHAPTGIDSMSVIVRDEELAHQHQSVLAELQRVLQPDRMEVLHGLALIATVGQGMSHRVGVASRVFQALAQAGVNVRMINQGASEINIIVGVANEDYETALRAIYTAFVTT